MASSLHLAWHPLSCPSSQSFSSVPPERLMSVRRNVVSWKPSRSGLFWHLSVRGGQWRRKMQKKEEGDGTGIWWQSVQATPILRRKKARAMDDESAEVSSVATSEKLGPAEEDDQANVAEILRILELLKKKRDMSFAEVKLTIMIEDPRDIERRKELGIEDERGCSREDMANALVEINEGRMPADRVVLQELTKEMLAWPNLEEELSTLDPAASPYAKVTPTGVDPKLAAQRARIDWDTAAEIESGQGGKDLSDMVPPAVGFSLLYIVSFIPVIIVVVVILILFFNSLQ